MIDKNQGGGKGASKSGGKGSNRGQEGDKGDRVLGVAKRGLRHQRIEKE